MDAIFFKLLICKFYSAFLTLRLMSTYSLKIPSRRVSGIVLALPYTAALPVGFSFGFALTWATLALMSFSHSSRTLR